jgi:3-oxoacyl-[acyl-carrier-protein] synthase II
MTRRVVITGMGVVSPLGCSLGDFAAGLFAGRSGAGPITAFDPAELPTRIAAQVRWEGPLLRDRKISFALEAARQAMEQAGACGNAPGPGPASASLGLGLELFSMDDMAAYRQPGFELPSESEQRLTFLQTPSDVVSHLLAHRYGLDAPPRTHVSACAAGTDAIGSAYRLIRSGRRGWMLAGGTDSMINPLGVAGFCKLAALSQRNDEPERASRPFDRTRDGFLLGEGAGILVLEELEAARARGATVLAEVCGYGNSFDAHGISEPHPEGRGAWQAMSRALADAGLGPEAVDCVNAHGTGTPKNDPVESLAIERLLGDRARQVPVVSTKSLIGHLISAAGAVEAIAAVLGMGADTVHPTLNLEEPDPRCRLDYVPGEARPHVQRHVISNSFGFGGQNASIVLGKVDA